MEWLFLPLHIMAVFIEFPYGGLIVAVVFLLIWRLADVKSAAVTGVVWLGYTFYEALFYLRILCQGDCNIRLDLLLIYPALIALMAATLVHWFIITRRKKISDK